MASSHMTMYPNTNVDYIKISQDITRDMTTAIQKHDEMKIDMVLLTQYDQNRLEAAYFASDGKKTKSKFTIYRKTPYQDYYQYICTLVDDYTITDYNIVSNQFYHYLISVEIPNGISGVTEYLFCENTDKEENPNYYYVKFDTWTICDVEVSTDDDRIYIKSGRTWELGLNLENEDLTVNRGITSWDTLGRFPKVSVGQKKYQSMSFSALLGKMIEYDTYSFTTEDGVTSSTSSPTYAYTEKLETYNNKSTDREDTLRDEKWGVWRKYARENDKLEAWNEFINNGNLKLLRDIKGNAWVIQVSESTTYNIATISTSQQTAINFQWKEALDISNKSIIIYGENKENDEKVEVE